VQDPAAFWRPIINDFRPVGNISSWRADEVMRFFVDRNQDNPTRSLFQLLKLNL
jgi:hypothetical protein